MVGGKYIFHFSHPSMVGGFTFSPFLCLNFVVSTSPTLDLPSEQVDWTPQLKHLFCLWRPCHPWQVAKAIGQIYFGYFRALPPPF